MSKRKTKQGTIATIHMLMRRPKWHNEAFARYDQKRLRKWSTEQRAKALTPLMPHIEESPIGLADQLIMREYYKPFVTKSRFVGIV